MGLPTPYYDKDGITIYCGDCLEIMPRLTPFFDTLIADWPYGTTVCEWDSVIPLEPLWKECKRLIRKYGPVVLTASDPFTPVLQMSNFDWYKYKWTWVKNRAANFMNAKNCPLSFTEDVLVFSEGTIANCSNKKMPYFPQGLKPSGELYKRPNHNSSDHRYYRKSHKQYGEGHVIEYTNYPSNVIEINLELNKTVHPTQKPVALMSYLILTYTRPGELVLDNTMGVGSTLVAAQKEGRRAVGIEIKENYCKIAADRLGAPVFFSLPSGLDGKTDDPGQLNFLTDTLIPAPP